MCTGWGGPSFDRDFLPALFVIIDPAYLSRVVFRIYRFADVVEEHATRVESVQDCNQANKPVEFGSNTYQWKR